MRIVVADDAALIREGIARVLVPRGLERLQVSAHGYESVVLEAPKGRVRVPMRPSER